VRKKQNCSIVCKKNAGNKISRKKSPKRKGKEIKVASESRDHNCKIGESAVKSDEEKTIKSPSVRNDVSSSSFYLTENLA